ncbi:hypothetical protein Y032_0020g201 [Ancylostoma ceylanicum]|uniref:Uncharacterized protein n=1 Tax=Ancylostoma ceylanicum TaxID=53326 RepID=A0A016V1F2_9BILA|nr:hypothetical protein Y032_0020g201 [Ancylostoma ceylanicum]
MGTLLLSLPQSKGRCKKNLRMAPIGVAWKKYRGQWATARKDLQKDGSPELRWLRGVEGEIIFEECADSTA